MVDLKHLIFYFTLLQAKAYEDQDDVPQHVRTKARAQLRVLIPHFLQLVVHADRHSNEVRLFSPRMVLDLAKMLRSVGPIEPLLAMIKHFVSKRPNPPLSPPTVQFFLQSMEALKLARKGTWEEFAELWHLWVTEQSYDYPLYGGVCNIFSDQVHRYLPRLAEMSRHADTVAAVLRAEMIGVELKRNTRAS